METKHLFRNNSPGVVGYTFYDEMNKRRGAALQPGESVWLTERDCVATASAPKDAADNPLDNGNLTFVTSEGDPEHERPIGIPGGAAPSSPEPEPVPEAEEAATVEDTEVGKAPEPTAEEAAREQAAKEEAAREEAAKRKIEEAEAQEAKEKAEAERKAAEEAEKQEAAQKAKEKTSAEEAAQRVGKEKADTRTPKQGTEQTANTVEKQGSSGEGSKSSTEQVGTPDALSD